MGKKHHLVPSHVFAQEIGDTDRLWNVAILFAGFCLLTSGVYIFNDLMDAGEDRLHPVKRFRPIASRKVSPMAALVFMFLLYATSALCFSFMYTSNNQIWLLSGGYILLNLAYTLYLKQVQIIDAMIVACGFIIRLEAGAAAGEIELSHWLIIMTFHPLPVPRFCQAPGRFAQFHGDRTDFT